LSGNYDERKKITSFIGSRKKVLIPLVALTGSMCVSSLAILIYHNLFLTQLLPSRLPNPSQKEQVEDLGNEHIENFLKQSNVVHDLVQKEVKDSLDRFQVLLTLFTTLLLASGTYWAKKTMKSELESVKEEMKSDFGDDFKKESLQLASATSRVLGLIVSMENIKFISDLSFNPISTEARQEIERYPETLKELKDHFNLQTLPAGFYVKLGDAFSLLGRYQLIEADSNHDQSRKEEGMKKFKNAIAAYNEALSNKPTDIKSVDRRFWADVFCKQGNSQAALGEYHLAVNDYEIALKIDPDHYWAIHSQGDVEVVLGDYNKAMTKYDEALRLPSASSEWKAETYYKKGIAYARQDKHDDAIDCYKDSNKRSPKNAWVLHSWGDSLRELEKYDDSIKKYEEALDINQRQYQTLVAWGDVLSMIGGNNEYKEALKKYERASEITSEDGVGDYEIHTKMGNIHLRLKEYFEAILQYDEAIRLYDQTTGLKTSEFRLWACRAYANEQHSKTNLLPNQEKKKTDENIILDRDIALQKIHDMHRESFEEHQETSSQKADFDYNQAVLHALSGHKSEAIQGLKQVILTSSKYLKKVSIDIGFIALQSDSEFEELIESSLSGNDLPVKASVHRTNLL
jgi:tetratricopeptide (TPR) repeat protein